MSASVSPYAANVASFALGGRLFGAALISGVARELLWRTATGLPRILRGGNRATALQSATEECPPGLRRLERLGHLYGPIAYARAVRQRRRIDRATAGERLHGPRRVDPRGGSPIRDEADSRRRLETVDDDGRSRPSGSATRCISARTSFTRSRPNCAPPPERTATMCAVTGLGAA